MFAYIVILTKSLIPLFFFRFKHNFQYKTLWSICTCDTWLLSFLFSFFQVNSTVILTVVTMLYIRSPEFTYLMIESLYICQHLPLFPSSAPGNHHSTLCFHKLDFLCITYEIIQFLFYADLFHLAQCPQSSSIVVNG